MDTHTIKENGFEYVSVYFAYNFACAQQTKNAPHFRHSVKTACILQFYERACVNLQIAVA